MPFIARTQKPIRLIALEAAQFKTWLATQPKTIAHAVKTQDFSAKAQTICHIEKGIIAGISFAKDLFAIAHLPLTLPEGDYVLDAFNEAHHTLWAIGWGIGSYQFTRYKKAKRKPAKLVCHDASIIHQVEALQLARDLVSTPSVDLHPQALAQVAKKLAAKHRARFHLWPNIKKNFPALYAVGRGGNTPPCMIEITWGKPSHFHLTLVGKGICFDSGGYDLKPPSAMRFMKKDMAGSADALALANLIMSEKLPIYLRVLIPAAENLIGSRAYRPGDVIQTRKGLSVEIGDTDAEGRLVLADALALACEKRNDLLIDFATLTGAARVALGMDIAAMFTAEDDLAEQIQHSANAVQDPLCRLPLHAPYADHLKSVIADCSNVSNVPYGGSITAALFLQKFVDKEVPWVHFDLGAWYLSSKPGRTEGAAVQTVRALYHYLIAVVK